MPVSFRTLKELINRLSPEQLDEIVTVETEDVNGLYCQPVELAIADEKHFFFDAGDPLLVLVSHEDEVKTDVNKIAEEIGIEV